MLGWLPTAAFATPYSLPDNEPFGDDVQTSCSSHWTYNCEADWDGVGQVGALSLVEHQNGVDVGVRIQARAGSTLFNGISRIYVVGSEPLIQTRVEVILLDMDTHPGGQHFNQVVTFFDANNKVLQTETHREYLATERNVVTVQWSVPPDAIKVQVESGMNEPDATSGGGSIYNENDSVSQWSAQACAQLSLECAEYECLISCPEGTKKVQDCTVAKNVQGHLMFCTKIETCYCEVLEGSGETDPTLLGRDDLWDLYL